MTRSLVPREELEQAELALADYAARVDRAELDTAPWHHSDGISRVSTDEIREMFRYLRHEMPSDLGRARDALAAPTIRSHKQLCEEFRLLCEEFGLHIQAAEVPAVIEEIEDWQRAATEADILEAAEARPTAAEATNPKAKPQ